MTTTKNQQPEKVKPNQSPDSKTDPKDGSVQLSGRDRIVDRETSSFI